MTSSNAAYSSDLGFGVDNADWVSIILQAGTTYQFDLIGAAAVVAGQLGRIGCGAEREHVAGVCQGRIVGGVAAGVDGPPVRFLGAAHPLRGGGGRGARGRRGGGVGALAARAAGGGEGGERGEGAAQLRDLRVEPALREDGVERPAHGGEHDQRLAALQHETLAGAARPAPDRQPAAQQRSRKGDPPPVSAQINSVGVAILPGVPLPAWVAPVPAPVTMG